MLGTFFDARLNDKSQYPVAAKSGEYNTRCKPDQLTGNNLHAPSEIGVDSFQADRSPTHMYRTAPLARIWSRQSRGFYHDGRSQTLDEVIQHYDQNFNLGLSPQGREELIEFMKSL
jgi:cytochrome c peroxidase